MNRLTFKRMTLQAKLSLPVRIVFSTFKWVLLVVESLLRGIWRNLVPYALQSKKQLNGKTVLLTGAGGGIGRELAKKLAQEGCRLVLWDADVVLNDQTAQACQTLGAKVFCQQVDCSNRKSVYAAAAQVGQDFGFIDILINNAGLLNPTSFLECEDERMSLLIDVNVKALFWTAKAFLPSMIDQRKGHIVTLGSVASIFGSPSLVDYTASKFAAFGFMESLCYQLNEEGHTEIKFTTVCPYFVHTPLIRCLSISDYRVNYLDVEYVAEQVVRAIRLEQRVMILPSLMYLLYALKGLLPWNLFQSIVQGRRVRV